MRNPLFIFFLLFIIATKYASAQVTVDNSSSVASVGQQSSISWSHTVGTANNRMLVVNFSGFSAGTQNINHVRFNGVDLTRLVTRSNGAPFLEMWYLLNPPSGTYTVSISYNKCQAVAGAVSFTGVDQATPFGTPAASGGTSISPSVTVSSAPGELVLDGIVSDNNLAHTVIAGLGQTQRWNTSNGHSEGAGSTAAGAASVTMSSILSLSRAWAMAAVSIKPTCYSIGTPTAIAVTSGIEPTCQLTNAITTTTYATTATNATGYNWSLSNASAGSINSTTGVMTWANGFSGSVDIRVTANGCDGPSAQVVRTVTITAAGTWTGSQSTSWNNAFNWECGIIPTSTTNVTIPSGLFNYPVISITSGAVNSLTLQSGTTITISNTTLQIAGTVTTAGGKITATAGKVEFTGSAAQIIPANLFAFNIIKDLVITNPSGVSLAGALRVTNSVGFGNVNNSSLSSNGFLSLVSTASSTANVLDITNDGLNTGNKINGNVTVERYVQGKRAYRFLTAPVNSATSIKANWMENTNNATTSVNNNPLPGYGTHITGTGGNANGFDATGTNNPSLFTFNSTSQSWVPASNTSGLFTAGNGFRTMVRGNRAVDLNNNSAASSSTTLRATGTLVTGPVVFAATGGTAGTPALSNVPGTYSFIANPYASSVNWEEAVATSTGISPTLYFFDPTISGSNGRGGYVSYNAVLKVKSITSSLVTKDVQSGQAFFVQTTSTNPSLTFNEAYKSSNFLPVFRTVNDVPHITCELLLPEEVSTGNAADGTAVYFSDNYSASIGAEDSYKFTNQDENIAIMRGNTALSLEGRNLVKGADSVPLKIWQLTKSNYTLKIQVENFQNNVDAYLEDKFLNILTPLAEGENLIPLSITSDAASKDPNRYRMIFESFATLPVHLTGIKAYAKNKGVQVDWIAESESNMDLYEVERSSDAQTFETVGSAKAINNPGVASAYTFFDVSPAPGDNYYRIKSLEKSGDVKLSAVLKVQMPDQKNTISILNNPVVGNTIRLLFDNVKKGNYNVRIFSSSGEKVYTGNVTYIGGTVVEQLELKGRFAAGVYQLQIAEGNSVKNIPVLIQ